MTRRRAEKKKQSRPAAKSRKITRYSSARPSTARSIEPSGPRSASPGPSIEHQVAAAIEAMLRLMAQTVTVRKTPLENSVVSSEKSLVLERPAYAKPASNAADVPIERQFCV